ncbi:putative carboxylesterase SOBER1-like [Glycine max]|nr:putative carboxylesterase SOBER1-like [Glycine max]
MTLSSAILYLWLQGLGDSGPANEPIKSLFTSSQFKDTKWSFPSAPSSPSLATVYGSVMPSRFDILEIPVTADSPNDESSLLKAVQNVHATIDKEIAAGINPNNIFICGFSQGAIFRPFSSRAYSGLGHSINNEELRYLESWIKSLLQISFQ